MPPSFLLSFVDVHGTATPLGVAIQWKPCGDGSKRQRDHEMGNGMEYLSGNRNVQYCDPIPGPVMFCICRVI